MNQKLSFKNNSLEYILTYFLIAITGINFFSAGDGFMVIGLIASYYFFRKINGMYSAQIINYILFFVVIQILQFAIMGTTEITTPVKIVFRILISYHILYFVGRAFPQYYVNVLFFFSILSFIFYFPSLIFPQFMKFFESVVVPITQPLFFREAGFQDIIIYNFGAQQWNRNSGPFWEPGAFVGFLSLAIIFDYLVNKKLFNIKKVVFYIAIVTTLSTAGYIVLFFTLLFFFYKKSYKLYPIFLILMLFPLGQYTYYNLDFLSPEINYAYDDAQKFSRYSSTPVNRFTSVILDLNDLKKSPFFGISDNGHVRYGSKYEDKQTVGKTWTHRNNGISYFLSAFGIVGFLVYFGCMYKSFERISYYFNENKSYAVFMMVVVFIVGFSEKYFTRELFFGLSILFVFYGNKKRSPYSVSKYNTPNKMNYLLK